MTLEEKLRAYAAKGELVHLSVVAAGGAFNCTFAAASPVGGYSTGHDTDPVEAIEKALKASSAKPARVSKPKNEVAEHLSEGGEFTSVKTGGLSSEWTTP